MLYQLIKTSPNRKIRKFHWFDHVNRVHHLVKTITKDHTLSIKIYERWESWGVGNGYRLVEEKEMGIEFAKVIAYSLIQDLIDKD